MRFLLQFNLKFVYEGSVRLISVRNGAGRGSVIPRPAPPRRFFRGLAGYKAVQGCLAGSILRVHLFPGFSAKTCCLAGSILRLHFFPGFSAKTCCPGVR